MFSRQKYRDNGLQTKIQIHKNLIRQALEGNNEDYKKQHPDWVRDGGQKNYTLVKKVLTDEHTKRLKEYDRRQRIKAGKD